MHYDQATLSYIDETIGVVDTANNIVCAQVNTLSPFVVAYYEKAGPGWGAASITGVEYGAASSRLNYLLVLLVPLCAGLVLRLRKRR